MLYANTLTKMLGIEYPIIQAGMAGGVTTAALVSEVSNAGGLGMIGAGYMKPEQLRELIQETKKRTDKPFAVNLFINEEEPILTNEEVNEARRILKPIQQELDTAEELVLGHLPKMEEQIEVLLKEKVEIMSFTFGIPNEQTIHRLKHQDVLLIGTATTVDEAILNDKAGMDAVVVQGFEAGGHRGTFEQSFDEGMIGTMALVPQVVDHVHIPVIAAGGIMDGRGIVASMALGARGVQMGSAFLTCQESGGNPLHKKATLERKETETIITRSFSGKPARGFQNRFTEMMKDHETNVPEYPVQNYLTNSIRQRAKEAGNAEFMSLWSGQGTRLSENLTVANFMKKLLTEVNETASNLFR
ncbi:NAD(P)H-dependent flavin oxidoreductase [Pseudalkalibacillus decolorationis]|uniref:NAD(P)H-dependent flavin oxidoreductase n=1 Tax=Pseudalkalibacillus decolorationis TaxID=163879 RepID=UPI002147A34A|nr:nitronate monooxygenase [Pseudalkalibacillus decolorationis]